MIEDIFIFRHGVFSLNRRTDLTGDAARTAAAEAPAFNANYTEGLLAEGVEQAHCLRAWFEELGIQPQVCLTSPYLRAIETAEVVFGSRGVPVRIDDDLHERNRGIYMGMPRELAKRDPAYRAKSENPLEWRPKGGETLIQAGERLERVLARALELYEGSSIALSTHADMTVAGRGLPSLGAMSTERIIQPLGPDLPKCTWVQNCQVDWYKRPPFGGDMITAAIRSVAVCGQQFDTGWMYINGWR